MRVEINSRDNGACPLCLFNENCRVQDILNRDLQELSSQEDLMELVIYSCPLFEEKS